MKTDPTFKKLPNGDRLYTHEMTKRQFLVRRWVNHSWLVIDQSNGRAIAHVGTLVQALSTIHFVVRSYYPS